MGSFARSLLLAAALAFAFASPSAPASDERMQGRGGDDYVIDSYQKISESYYGIGRESNVGEGEYLSVKIKADAGDVDSMYFMALIYMYGEKKCRCLEEYS